MKNISLAIYKNGKNFHHIIDLLVLLFQGDVIGIIDESGDNICNTIIEWFYQLANGHHRVAALRSFGVETIKIFLTK